MINIDYYPPFMIDIRNKYTCKPMCDYLCEKWKSIINEKQKIIDLTNEYIKNKHAKNNIVEHVQLTSTIGPYNTNVQYVDISNFVDKYNQFVDIYNNCVDSLNDTIYHIMRSPDNFEEYYTKEELQKLHADLNEMINKEKLLKRDKLVLTKTVFELSQDLLDILNSTDKLVENIIIEILDMVELKKYFKFDPFEKIIKDQIGGNQIGGALSLNDVKIKIDLIIEKLKTLPIKTSDAKFLKNHTSFSSIDESIEMLDKLNLQISNKKFKDFEIDLSQLQFPQQLIDMFLKENTQAFSVNFDYNNFDLNKLQIVQQKITFLKTANDKIRQKILQATQNFNGFGTNVDYLPKNIVYDDNILKTEHDRLIKELEILNKNMDDVLKVLTIFNVSIDIMRTLTEQFNKIDNDKPSLENFLKIKEKKQLATSNLYEEIKKYEKILDDKNVDISIKINNNKNKLFFSINSKIDLLYESIISILKRHENKKQTMKNIKTVISNYVSELDQLEIARRIKAGSSDHTSVTKFLVSKISEQINDYIEENSEITDEIYMIKSQIKNIDDAFQTFEQYFNDFKKSEIYAYMFENYLTLTFEEMSDRLTKKKSDLNVNINTKISRIAELKNQIGLSKDVDYNYFEEKIKIFNKKIDLMYKNINKKIQSLNKFLPSEEQVKIMDTTIDMWYTDSQVGGTITSDKGIILDKIQQFSHAQMNILNKIKELSEEMRLFRLGINDYIKAVAVGVKQDLQMLYSMSYILTVFREITMSKFQIIRFIEYDKFQEIKIKINSYSNQILQPIIIRMKNLCEFIDNDFKDKQHFSIIVDESNKLFIDLIVLVHLSQLSN